MTESQSVCKFVQDKKRTTDMGKAAGNLSFDDYDDDDYDDDDYDDDDEQIMYPQSLST